MKWSFNVLIARSSALWICIPVVASWNLMSLELSSIWKGVEASLSSLIYDVLIPLVSRCSCRSLKTRMNLLSGIALMGKIKILFLSHSYNTNRYLFTLFEVTVNLPVKSVAI